MPKGVVKTKRDEAKWSRAKRIAKRQYPEMGEGKDFYAVTSSIYKTMKKSAEHVKKELLQKAAEIIGMYSEEEPDRNLVLDTYIVLHNHLSGINRELHSKEKVGKVS